MGNFGSILALLLICLTHSQVNQTLSLNGSSIYGVRWFLAQKFSFQQPITIVKKQRTQSHLMVFFNSLVKWQSYNFSIQIESNHYACSWVQVQLNITASHHKSFNQFASTIGKSFTYFIHKCPILFKDQSFLSQVSHFAYKIWANSNQKHIQVFQSTLRSPSFNKQQMQMTVFGDWGTLTNYSKQSQISIPITQCLSKQIMKNPNIRLMLLLGDIGYDLQGASYVNFFKYLQPFSEQLVILFTPGNHQTIKHKDIFQLVKQSFYSPFWSHFYGYFDLVQLGKYAFIGFSSQGLFPSLAKDSNSSLFQVELQKQYQNHYNLFAMQVPQQTKDKLKQYTMIGYSHYPIYCSEQDNHQSCNIYLKQHLPYLTLLRQLGMQLYFSGHLHVYERSKQICNKGTLLQNGKDQSSIYAVDKDCTIFIVQGVGGNNYFVQTKRHFNLKNHSQKAFDNTGFGLLQINSNTQQTKFKHIQASDSCQIVDQIIISNPHIPKYYSRMAVIIIAILLLFILIRLVITKTSSFQKMEGNQRRRTQTSIMFIGQTE